MAKKRLFFVFSSVLFCTFAVAEEHNCIQESPCVCRFNDGRKIDLSPLGNLSFLEDSNEDLTYFFHGCGDANFDPKVFNIKAQVNDCTRPLSMCLYNKTGNGSLTYLGSVKDTKFADVASTPNTQKLILTLDKTSVSLILACAEYAISEIKVLEKQPADGQHSLLLFSPHACLTAAPTGLSAGTVLLILFTVGVLAYLIIGGLLLRVLRGARGLEMIPNLQFWTQLPALTRDGAIFLLSGCRPTALVTTMEAYDRI